MDQISVAQIIGEWLDTIANENTVRTYASGMDALMECSLINATDTLQAFALRNHEAIIDRIKRVKDLKSESIEG